MTIKEIALKYGCGDNSCMFGSHGGMSTNGGCYCFRNTLTHNRIRKIQMGIMALRKTIQETQNKADDIILCRRCIKNNGIDDG